MSAARSWSSQKPGAPICSSSCARRAASASGSKVITDPRQAGSDLLELRFERLGVLVGHAPMVAKPAWAGRESARPTARYSVVVVLVLVGLHRHDLVHPGMDDTDEHVRHPW